MRNFVAEAEQVQTYEEATAWLDTLTGNEVAIAGSEAVDVIVHGNNQLTDEERGQFLIAYQMKRKATAGY